MISTYAFLVGFSLLVFVECQECPSKHSCRTELQAANAKFSFIGFGKLEHFKLNGMTIQTENSTTISECQILCLNNSDCFSINHGPQGECEVLKEEKVTNHTTLLVKKSGWVHQSIQSSCESNPCSHPSYQCIPNHVNGSYKCVSQGFHPLLNLTFDESYDNGGTDKDCSILSLNLASLIFDPGRRTKVLYFKSQSSYGSGGEMTFSSDTCISNLNNTLNKCLNGGLTFSFWFRVMSAEYKNPYIIILDTKAYGFRLHLSGRIATLKISQWKISLATSDASYTCQFDTHDATEWVFVSMIFDLATMKCFINGDVMQVSRPSAEDQIFLTTQTKLLWRYYSGPKHSAIFDDILYYDRPLTDEEIRKLYLIQKEN